MRIAIIEAGVVTNICEASQEWVDVYGGVVIPDGSTVGIGHTYDGVAFTAPAIVMPTQAEQFKAIEQAFEQHMDAVAKSKGYDSRDSCRLYAGYPNPFQAEATAFGQWVANTWVLAFQQQQDVVAGTRPMPTAEGAVAEIPAMVWPA